MRIFWRILVVVVIIAAIAGIGVFAYNAGLAHGGTQIVQSGGAGGEGTVFPHLYRWHPMAWFGWGPLGCLIPLFLLFLVFAGVRALFWPHPWGWHHMHRRWWRDGGEGDRGTPPFFDEWHRRAHTSPDQDKAPEEKQK